MTPRFFAALVSLMMMTALLPQAWGAHFVQPKYNGYDLDWCRNFEQGCGQPAADLYCQKRGYTGSSAFQIMAHVNVPTMTIGQNAICNPAVHGCDSFEYVDCKETKKVFNVPTYNGYRLDWCSQFEQGCGQAAAQKFCQKNGFTEVINFQKQGQLNVPTMVIGSNAVCNPKYHVCDGFTSIECLK